MNLVIKLFLLTFFLGIHSAGWSQKNSEKLRKEQERLEKSISVTKGLLKKAKLNTEATLSELRVLENQVKYREELLKNFDSQIRSTELKIDQKQQQIIDLEEKLQHLIYQYKELLLYAYKHRSKEGQWMYIFAAKNYNEAVKRKKYLIKIAELQRKQKQIIVQHQRLISNEKTELEKEKQSKISIAEQKKIEKEDLLVDKKEQEINYDKLKKAENKLAAEMKLIENKKIILKQRIKEAISAELAAEESRRKANERKNTQKNNTNVATQNTTNSKTNVKGEKSVTTSSNSIASETPKKTITISETREVELNQNFESNRGRLPWPVERGTITEGYGRQPHPKLKEIYTNNNGVDISTHRNANVRSVFDGEVTSVLSIPGAGKIVIIKHGNYRTVYSNLQEVYVGVGSKIKTKQAVGSLLSIDGEALSISHFEIHQVSNGQINRMNPSSWITR
jgi:septal ring factor EnvC (AmiA/AmiB activator)